jgi:two-component system CheB/CheR fusion protein
MLSSPDALPRPSILAMGASAGGLRACRQLLDAMPAETNLAVILVQHLDPAHTSLLVDLLVPHTSLTVQTATEGMRVERGHLYVIPPGMSLAVRDGVLHLSPPAERRGTRLPFDFLLVSMAAEQDAQRYMAVILSGSGEDGKEGARALRAAGGFVLAQDPAEAEFDGMPRAAIAAGAVDAAMPIARMPDALLLRLREVLSAPDPNLARILALLRDETGHDFTLYKPGTLRRRIARRMGLAGCQDLAAYLARLQADAAERTQLSKDLLIHVTGFFRDPEVFEALAARVIPDLVKAHPVARPLRVWVTACSSGEEAWSLAILFCGAIAEDGRGIRLQVFASDKDAEAVARARQALYPASAEAEIPPDRLAAFFLREEVGLRVSAALRAQVIFSVQDTLFDPPFSRLDFVSCRNFLIYLRPEAQARVIALLRFALRPGGLLLLGTSETIGDAQGFEPAAEAQRVWRRTARRLPAEPGLLTGRADAVRAASRGTPVPREARLAELCRRLVVRHHAPASVLVDRTGACLHALGTIERHLSHAAGPATQDIVALARPVLRGRLRALLEAVRRTDQEVLTDASASPSIELRRVTEEEEELFFITFLEIPEPATRGRPGRSTPRREELERELTAVKAELRGAIQELEAAAEDRRAANEEALSVNEEYQSTNEELLTSKEELQSLNEELTALNTQLQETLDVSRTTSDDLQNVLYSTEVATLFLDRQLRIRFFTPATRALFSVLPGDIGRPLADLRSLANDGTLLEDAAAVLAGAAPRLQEVTTATGQWFSRRVMPYRARDGGVEGVVLTFTDITERRAAARALEEAIRMAEAASAAKSRFLAAASHDLRQPLQTLHLLQALLADAVQDEETARVVALLEPTLTAMGGMLDTLLDLHQLEAGTLTPEPVAIPIGPLLDRLAAEFRHLATAQGLELRHVPCTLAVRTDPQLLEQILRNLLSNALKFTRTGRVLLGCRRHGAALTIEVWDSGSGIADTDLLSIFEENRQVDPAPRGRGRSVGLGLAIVQRLARLLGHRLQLRSIPGRGSMFSVEAPRAAMPALAPLSVHPPEPARLGGILLVEDEPDLGLALSRVLLAAGHRVMQVPDAQAALALVARGRRPDLLLVDHDLPGMPDGPGLAETLRSRLEVALPAIVLTADVSPQLAGEVARHGCALLVKPASASALLALVQRLLPMPDAAPRSGGQAGEADAIHIVDDDAAIRAGLRRLLEKQGWAVHEYASAEAFLARYAPGAGICVLLDAQLPGMSGLDLLKRLRMDGDPIAVLMITGFSDVAVAVEAMRAGASDFVEKPLRRAPLLAGIARAVGLSRDAGHQAAWRQEAARRLARLTPRQREVMTRVLAGEPSKNIAADLGISQRTVETHRAEVMRRTGATSLPDLVRIALAASAAA